LTTKNFSRKIIICKIGKIFAVRVFFWPIFRTKKKGKKEKNKNFKQKNFAKIFLKKLTKILKKIKTKK